MNTEVIPQQPGRTETHLKHCTHIKYPASLQSASEIATQTQDAGYLVCKKEEVIKGINYPSCSHYGLLVEKQGLDTPSPSARSLKHPPPGSRNLQWTARSHGVSPGAAAGGSLPRNLSSESAWHRPHRLGLTWRLLFTWTRSFLLSTPGWRLGSNNSFSPHQSMETRFHGAIAKQINVITDVIHEAASLQENPFLCNGGT